MENLFNHAYPYLDEHELNPDWIIAKMKELIKDFDEFKVVNNITFSGEWDITKQYPAWTIVSDNNIGYVSIQPVPVGVVLTNGDYWVEVIDYTAQIAGLETRMIAAEYDIANLQGRVGTLETTSANHTREINKLRNRNDKYALLSDSFGDYWFPSFKQYLNLTDNTDVWSYNLGGQGFTSGTPFITMLDTLVASVSDPAEITKLVIVGGTNDVNINAGAFDYYTAVINCVNYARTLFVNADVCVGFIASLYRYVDITGNAHARIPTYAQACQQACMACGAKFLGNLSYTVANRNVLTDDVHPDTDASVNMTQGFIAGIYNEPFYFKPYAKTYNLSNLNTGYALRISAYSDTTNRIVMEPNQTIYNGSAINVMNFQYMYNPSDNVLPFVLQNGTVKPLCKFVDSSNRTAYGFITMEFGIHTMRYYVPVNIVGDAGFAASQVVTIELTDHVELVNTLA